MSDASLTLCLCTLGAWQKNDLATKRYESLLGASMTQRLCNMYFAGTKRFSFNFMFYLMGGWLY